MKKAIGQFGTLELIAFVGGFTLMAFELIGARMLAPTIGSSTYVWTSVIGIIIAALSVGYFLGGKLADSRNRVADIALLCLGVAVGMGSMMLLFDATMDGIVRLEADLRLKGVIASCLLFAPTSLLIGMLSPYLVKLKITSLERSGQSVASLSVFESVGGIIGTFVTGFIVFSYVGSREALLVIVVLMIAVSWLLEPRKWATVRAGITIFAVGMVTVPLIATRPDVIRIDTPSANYEVHTGRIKGETRALRYLTTGPYGTQSGIYINQPNELAFWYTREIVRLVELAASKQRILILGGGAFTVPEYLARTYPNNQFDVVEIDPVLQRVAVEHFNYRARDNVRVIDMDARAYINTTAERYDVVIVDVYGDSDVPFSLMTREYAARLAAVTGSEATIIVNTISAEAGPCSELLRAVDAAYRLAAPYASLSRADMTKRSERGNMILAYTKQPYMFAGTKTLDPSDSPAYIDNFMPAERLQQLCQSWK